MRSMSVVSRTAPLVQQGTQPIDHGKLIVLSSNFAGKELALTKPQMGIGRTNENELMNLGAIFEKVRDWQPLTIVDDRLVTGQNPASSTGTAQALLQMLDKKAAA